MCGICGVVQLDGEPRRVVSPETLDRMTDVMTHRGPNDRGTHLAPGIALGVRRLSIVDVAGGHQPVSNEERQIWAIQNGELYNHLDLRRELESERHRYGSHCDTEILPHLYESVGKRYPERLRGKFATCVWDAGRRQAIVARDRLGVKPLYYAQRDDLVVFASELKSLLASGLVKPELDYEAIDAYLTLGFVPGPSTPLDGVFKLLPGHRLLIADGRAEPEPYWKYPLPEVATPRLREEEYGAMLLEQLEDAVRARLMSDVPLGAMLSGGLDSSLIVALMARNMTEPVKTFSVGFVDEGVDSELADARLVASALGAEHHELELSLQDSAIDLTDLVWYMDEPLADLSSLGFLALSELAAGHVTVALAGQGADELLGGYQKHRAASLAERWHRLPGPVRTLGEAIGNQGPPRFRRMARTFQASDSVTRLLNMSSNLDPSLRSSLYTGPLAAVSGHAARDAVAGALRGVTDRPLAATLHADAQLALVDDMLHYFDRASMARSLEVRVPFLDHHVVELCAQIPTDLKVRGLTTKYLLKKISAGLLPDGIIHKRKIGFFHGAISDWFRAQTDGAISDYLLGPNPRYCELLDRTEVERLINEHRVNRRSPNGRLLLSILLLEIWLSSFLPRACAPAEPVANSGKHIQETVSDAQRTVAPST
jgi:asparagine synthase (glutamine-hydrolysing)